MPKQHTGAVDVTKVSVTMPTEMHKTLIARAQTRGITVTELIRRSVMLDALIFEHGADVYIIDRDGEKVKLHFL